MSCLLHERVVNDIANKGQYKALASYIHGLSISEMEYLQNRITDPRGSKILDRIIHLANAGWVMGFNRRYHNRNL